MQIKTSHNYNSSSFFSICSFDSILFTSSWVNSLLLVCSNFSIYFNFFCHFFSSLSKKALLQTHYNLTIVTRLWSCFLNFLVILWRLLIRVSLVLLVLLLSLLLFLVILVLSFTSPSALLLIIAGLPLGPLALLRQVIMILLL